MRQPLVKGWPGFSTGGAVIFLSSKERSAAPIERHPDRRAAPGWAAVPGVGSGGGGTISSGLRPRYCSLNLAIVPSFCQLRQRFVDFVAQRRGAFLQADGIQLLVQILRENLHTARSRRMTAPASGPATPRRCAWLSDQPRPARYRCRRTGSAWASRRYRSVVPGRRYRRPSIVCTPRRTAANAAGF